MQAVKDLRKAIHAYGRAKETEKAATRRHIISQAKRIKRTDLIPRDWLTSAGVVVASPKAPEPLVAANPLTALKAKFQEWMHPRGHGGKFVEKGGSVNVSDPKGGKSRRGTIKDLTRRGPEVTFADTGKTELIPLADVANRVTPAPKSGARLNLNAPSIGRPGVPKAPAKKTGPRLTPDRGGQKFGNFEAKPGDQVAKLADSRGEAVWVKPAGQDRWSKLDPNGQPSRFGITMSDKDIKAMPGFDGNPTPDGGTPAPGKAPTPSLGELPLDEKTISDLRSDPNSTAATNMVQGPDGSWDWTPERKALHEKIIGKFLEGKTKPAGQPSFNVMGGGPAAGKSNMVEKAGITELTDPNSVMVNADEMKAELPEYQSMTAAKDPKAATLAHEESSYLAKRLQQASFDNGFNTILDGTGDSNAAKMNGKLDAARQAGYSVKGYYVTVPTDVAVARADARGQATGRFVPERVIRTTHIDVSKVFPDVYQSFDSVDLFQSEGELSPIASWDGKSLNIKDQTEWNAFLAKANEDPGRKTTGVLPAGTTNVPTPAPKAAPAPVLPKGTTKVPTQAEVLKIHDEKGAQSPEYRRAFAAYNAAKKAPAPKAAPATPPRVQAQGTYNSILNGLDTATINLIQNTQDAMNLTPEQRIHNVELMFGTNSKQYKAAVKKYAPKGKGKKATAA